MSKYNHFIKLVRPDNAALAAACCFAGAIATWYQPVYIETVIICLVAFLVSSADSIFKALATYESDRIYRTHQPLVTGLVSSVAAVRIGITINIVAILLALIINLMMMLFTLFVVALLLYNNLYGRKYLFIGNILTGLTAALAVIGGSLAIDRYLTLSMPGALIPAVYVFIFVLVCDILSDLKTVEADRSFNRKTIALKLGTQTTMSLILVLFFILVLASYYPVLSGWYSDWYKILAVYIFDLPIMAVLIILWGNPSANLINRTQSLLKIGAIIGLAALFGA